MTTTATPAPVRVTTTQGPGHRPSAVRLRGVTKAYGHTTAVRGLDLELAQGEVVAFLGPNGAGKTTTIDMVLGLSRPTDGAVEVLGMTPRQAVARGLVAAVLQSGGLLKDLTVRETVAYTASLFASARDVDDVLAEAGIDAIAGRRVGACSGGEQQRLRFAMALLPDPALLLLDEPTTGMDVEGRRSFWAAVRADARRGRTVLFATHYLEEADQYADRIVLVADGRVVADGSGPEIRALASGRHLRVVWPGAEPRALEDLSRRPGVESVEVHGDAVLLRTVDAAAGDDLARHLLTATPAHDLEVTSPALEDAFVHLTRRQPTASEGTR